MAATGSSTQSREVRRRLHEASGESRSLPLATLVALLATMLGVSVLSSYDEELRWLRFGMLLLAFGLAMWLPYGWAALSAAAISLATAFARGGLTDTGVLRPETMLEVPGMALTAVLVVSLRRQMESLLSAGVQESRSGGTSAGIEESDVQPRAHSERALPTAAREPAVPQGRYGVRGVTLARTEDSWAFAANAKAALAALELELQKTRIGIGAMRARPRLG